MQKSLLHSSSDEESDRILKPALEVIMPTDFNPASVPQDGYEYLQHVIYQRNLCKRTAVTRNIDPRNFDKYQTLWIELDSPKSVPSSVIPSEKWKKTKCDEFDQFRKLLESNISENTQFAYFNEDSFIESISNTLPTFTKFTKYSQNSKIRMLEIITTHLNSSITVKNLDDNLCIWIFAVLSTLEYPFTPSCCFALRDLAKKLIDIRASLSSQDSEVDYTSLNFFICIISTYFKQFDLAD